MANFIALILISIAVSLSITYGFNHAIGSTSNNRWLLKPKVSYSINNRNFNPLKCLTRMSMTTEETGTEAAPTVPKSIATDFSKYSVGQEYEGKAISALPFGIFVDISTGTNVLIPRSQTSRSSYDKLKNMAEQKSDELIKISLIGVNAENGTLSAKYMPSTLKERPDISTIDGDLTGKTFKATVVSAHTFGIFAKLEGLEIDGLVPASKLPEPLPAATIQESYPVGAEVEVKVEQMSVGDKKLVLSMRAGKGDISSFDSTPHDMWMQGVVESVASFGLFVRPVGSQATGLVHFSRVPRNLLNILKSKLPATDATTPAQDGIAASKEPLSMIQQCFAPGDVIKVRVHEVSTERGRLELSMLRYRANTDEEDTYIVEGRDKEGEEYNDNFDDQDDDDEEYDPEDTVLWWQGSPYVKTGPVEQLEDEDTAVLKESSSIVEGTWRRMFELDLRADEADFSSRAIDMDLKEIADEIGELDGLDAELVGDQRFGNADYGKAKFGSFVGMKNFPSEWQKEMLFFQDLETAESSFKSKLRGGKSGDISELESLLKEVEAELNASAVKPTPVSAAAENVSAAAAAVSEESTTVSVAASSAAEIVEPAVELGEAPNEEA